MDFSYLLELAKANEEKSKNDNSIKFSTKPSKAKKIEKPGPKKDAILQHLNKIDEDKKKKLDAFNKKRDALLEMRAKDKNSAKRVKSLLTRTKGASKAVLDDAKDIGTAKCEAQCDEDDYGYESTMSQQIFSKLQNVYCEIPEDERLKFKKTSKGSMDEIKKRVMDSLKKKEEEDLGLRKRHRNRSKKTMRGGRGEEDDGFINDGDAFKKFEPGSDDDFEQSETSFQSFSQKKKKSKKSVDLSTVCIKEDKLSNFKYNKVNENNKSVKKSKKSANNNGPPALSFSELMKMAQKKTAEPLPAFDPLQELKNMQKKNVKEEIRLMTSKEKRIADEEKMSKSRKSDKNNSDSKSKTATLEKQKSSSNNQQSHSNTKSNDYNKESSSKNHNPNKDKHLKINSNNTKSNVSEKSDQKNNILNHSKTKTAENTYSDKLKLKDSSKTVAPNPTKKPDSQISNNKVDKFKSRDDILKRPPPSFPSKSSRPPSQTFKKRMIDSDDEEYDSEMDDFIDDGEEEMDYSSEIAKMFKYDKSKFRNEPDDDIDDMEVSYAQVQREEKRSAKIGLMEDLEDIRREEEEKKRKRKLNKIKK